MSDLRQDPLSGRWVVLAAERARKPEGFAVPPASREAAGPCPFCPGHEDQTPHEILRKERNGAWRVRVVPNKYASLAPLAPLTPTGDPLHLRKPSAGFAEVVIESPEHLACFDTLDPADALAVVSVYQERYDAHLASAHLRSILVFRNYLAPSGASLLHPHSQILATAHLPPVLEAEAASFARHQEGSAPCCLLCDLLASERESERRVADLPGFVTIAPYASAFPFELLVAPEACGPDLRSSPAQAIADALRDALRRLRTKLGDPPVNVWFHCAPTGTWAGGFHWHIHVVPRLSVWGGWEHGSGLPINVMPPEQAAEFLR